MKLHHQAGIVLSAGMFIAASAAHTEEYHRQLPAHVHGHGTLAIAFEANNVQMELAAPGMDIVGFEHEAKTAEQKNAVETALADLKEPLNLFAFPGSAGCAVTSADVKVVEEDHKHNEEHGHSHGHGHSHASAEAGGAEGSEEHEDHHAEFRATYLLACADAAKITSIDFPFFDRFAGSEELDVMVIDANGQTTYEVSRESRRLEMR